MTTTASSSAKKLNLEKAREIRAKARKLFESKNPPMAAMAIDKLLGDEYGVSIRAIQNIRYGKTYPEGRAS